MGASATHRRKELRALIEARVDRVRPFEGGCAAVLPAVSRLDDIPGLSLQTAQVIIAEIGLEYD